MLNFSMPLAQCISWVRVWLTIVIAVFFAASAPARADDHFEGYWRGTHSERGGGSGPFVSIVDMTVTPRPPRSIRDSRIAFTVALRIELSGQGPRVKLAPAAPIGRHPLPYRPEVVPDLPPTIALTAVGALGADVDGTFLHVNVQPGLDPRVPAAGQCGFLITITLHGGPLGDAVYYQIIPQRSPCAGGPFAGIAYTRGYLAR